MFEANNRRDLAARLFSWSGLEGAAGLAMLMTAVYAASSTWLSATPRRWLEWVFPIAGAIVGDLYFGTKARRAPNAQHGAGRSGDDRR
jgi:hypothetical protein